MKSKHKLFTSASLLAALLLAPLAHAADAPDAARDQDEWLPKENLVLKSLKGINLSKHFARFPIHKGTFKGKTYWFVVSDVSDEKLARQLGLNWAPKLANAGRGCPSCVQVLKVPRDLTKAMVEFKGVPDFAPKRMLMAGPQGFPAQSAAPGAVAGPNYTPYVQIAGTNIVYNAPIIAVGDQPMDFKTHADTHDRLLAMDMNARTADILLIRAFSGGEEIMYTSFDSSSAEAATIERATFTPGLGLLSFPNGAFRKDGARAAIFSFTNGKTGRMSPPAQGLNHVILDGRNAEDASLDNTRLIEALRMGGDARNVLEVFPTMRDARFRLEYSPAWDLHLTVWNKASVRDGRNDAQMDSFTIRNLGNEFTVASPGGFALAAAGIEVNCPVLGFVSKAPVGPLTQTIDLPKPFQE